MPPDIAGTLEQIHEAAGYIEIDTAGMTFDAFMDDPRSRQAVERNFEIIGEAVNRLRHQAPSVSAPATKLWRSTIITVMVTTGSTTPLSGVRYRKLFRN